MLLLGIVTTLLELRFSTSWDVSGDYNLVDTTVKRLRQHIEDDPKKPLYIETVWGVGFRFNDKQAERSK